MTNNENHKMSARQWSLRRMFFWVLFAALVCSQLSRIYHATIGGVNDFTLSESQIKDLIRKLDPSARAQNGGISSERSRNEVDSKFDYWISADAATPEQVMSHLRKSIIAKTETEGWRITGWGRGGNKSFQFSLSKGATRFKIYCWELSDGNSRYEKSFARQGKNVFRKLMLQIGYTRE